MKPRPATPVGSAGQCLAHVDMAPVPAIGHPGYQGPCWRPLPCQDHKEK